MAKHAPRNDAGESDLEVGDRKTHAAGVPGGAPGAEDVAAADGGAAYGAHAGPAQPDEGLRLPRLRLARPRPPQPLRVLRERREGRRRGGDPAPCRPRLLRRRTRSPSSAREPTTGSGSRAGSPSRCTSRPAHDHYEPITWDEAFRLIAERLHGAAHPGRRGVLHLGPHVERGGVPLPADGPPLRHEQPARLLEHVPRVAAAPRSRTRSGSARARSCSRTSTPPT